MDRGELAASAAATADVVVEGVAPELPASVRIYVGGLGAGVNAADIEKTFSSLGAASRVEFVQRSDSHRFAYMDFKPHSEKSLAKLFATYNGCIWKGGRLKLEKAKEHYMDRLKREWADNAQIMTGVRLNSSDDQHDKFSEESMLKPEEKSHLRIFFPKLKKVKALPFKGTGRHKYSFQRVEVPPLPVNFCDCEEHCKPCCDVAKEQSFQNTGIDVVVGDAEMNVMNSVMAKLFSRDADKNVLDVPAKPTNSINGNPSNEVHEDEIQNETKSEEIEADDSEEGNFVMNFGATMSDNMMDLLQAKEWGKKPTAQDGLKQPSQQLQEKTLKKRQQPEDDTPALKSVSDGKRIKSVSDGHRKWFPDLALGTKESSETPAEQLEDFSQQQSSVVLESKENHAITNSGKGSTWVQKSSWKDLVGNTSSSLFSISSILPSDMAMKLKPRKTCDEATAGLTKKASSSHGCDVDFSIFAKQQINFPKKPTDSNCQETLGEACGGAAQAGMTNTANVNRPASNNKETVDRAKLSNEGGGTCGTVVSCNQEPKVNTPVRIGEVCTFMRTADSEKQWTKAKTALTSYFKKKSNTDSSSKLVRDRSKLRN